MTRWQRFTSWAFGWPEWNYVDAIKVLAPDKPLSLPAVQPLRAARQAKPWIENVRPSNVSPFERKRA